MVSFSPRRLHTDLEEQQFTMLQPFASFSRTRQIEELHVLFVDFSAAFDSVSWIALEQILQGWRVPEKLRSAICGQDCAEQKIRRSS